MRDKPPERPYPSPDGLRDERYLHRFPGGKPLGNQGGVLRCQGRPGDRLDSRLRVIDHTAVAGASEEPGDGGGFGIGGFPGLLRQTLAAHSGTHRCPGFRSGLRDQPFPGERPDESVLLRAGLGGGRGFRPRESGAPGEDNGFPSSGLLETDIRQREPAQDLSRRPQKRRNPLAPPPGARRWGGAER